MDINEKLKNIDQKTIDNALGIAEKLFGSQVSSKAKETLQNSDELQQIIGKLTKDDMAAIEKALSGKSKDVGEAGKRLKDILGG